MRFFVRIGALLHFEDTPRNLHEYFYLNMNVVSLILVALASGGCTFLSSGVIHVRHIYSLFKKLSVSDADGNALFALLIKLSVLVPLDCRRCLLPFRLPSEKPGLNLALSQYLSPCEDTTNTGTSGPTYVRRLYSAPCLPSCFWGRFISALVLQIQGVLDSLETVGKHRAKTNAIFWAGGIVALYDEGCLVVNAVMNNDWNEDVKPMESSRVCVKNGLDIVVFDRRRQFAALGLVCSHIEALFQEWIDQNGPYGDHTSSRSEFLAESTVERLIPYPAFAFSLGQSEDEALNSFIFEHAIPEKATLLKVEDCAQAIINYSKMMDPTGSGGFIDVSHVAPDLILASLPPSERFQEDDVQIEITSSSNLGRGSFANVYLGYLGDTKVAFKVFASNLLPPTVDCVHFELKEDHFSLRKKSSRRAHGQIFSRRNCKAMKKVATLKQLKLLASVGTIGEARVSDDEVKSASPPIAPQFDSSQCFKHMQDLLQEATVMKQLRHPNIVQFKGVLFEPYPCLVMEFAPGGNLATLIKTRREEIGTVSGLMSGVHFSGAAHDGIMGRELTHRIAFQVALGIEYLHSKAICHLDMKPENVLVWSESLTAPVNVKLTDYGISCTVTAVGLSSTRGTLGYQAPEQVIMRNNISKSFDLRVDVFAYGMMMYYLLMGVHPYESDMDKLTVVEQKIRQNDRPPLPTGQSLVHLQSVIDRCWQYWPSERPSASQIVAEICEPSFHLQCMDLLVNGSHEVLATALMMDQSGTVCFDSVDSETIGTCVESRRRAYTWGLPSTARIPLKQKKVLKKRPTSLFQTSPPKSPERARSPSPDRAILPRSFSNEMLTHYEEAVDKFHLRSPTPSVLPPSIEEERNTNHIKTEMKSKYPEDSLEASCEDSYSSESSSEDEETIKKPPSFALLITADSLLVANPPVSCFLCKQDTKKIISSVVSAVLYLNSWLWVGLHSKELQVFQCVGGEISRRIKQLSFSCNAVIEDIQCQFFKAQTQVKIFALLANGQIIVIHGHQYKNKADSPRLLNEWGRDLLYCWDHPEIRSVGKIGLEEEEAVSVASCMVLVQPGELWYCQGNSIVAVNTAKSPEEVIRVHGSITDSVTVPDIRMIKEAVVVGDSVWCSDRIESDELCEIDISSRSPKKTWRLKELYSDRDKWSHMVTVEGSSTNRKCHWQNVPSMNSLSVQCLAAVCDTLWVGCNNGAILIMHKDSAERIQLLATLWCRPAVDYFTGQKQGSLPSVVMSRIRQVGDRVLVYHKTHPRNDQKAGQTVVTEVFQAVDSSQLCTLGSYYSIHNA
jgi:serine/threonine protein kinase